MKALVVVVASVTALVFPAGAFSATCAPPGNSGVSQYFETIPGANCNQSPPGSSGGHGGHGGALPASTSHQLSKAGATGKAVENLVASTGPGSGAGAGAGNAGKARSSGSGGTTPGARSKAALSAGGGSNPVSGLLHPIVTGSTPGGIGILLPLVLLGAVLLIAAGALLRRHRMTQDLHE
jgi:hypothetical protein